MGEPELNRYHLLAGAVVGALMLVPGLAEDQPPSVDTRDLTSCKSNLKTIGLGLEMYSTDNSGYYPTQLGSLTPKYLRIIPVCPAAGQDTYSASYRMSTEPDAYEYCCQGQAHKAAQVPANHPRYDSTNGLTER
jgi:hypothetical protein